MVKKQEKLKLKKMEIGIELKLMFCLNNNVNDLEF